MTQTVSEVFRRRERLRRKLEELDEHESSTTSPAGSSSPSLPASYLDHSDLEGLQRRRKSVNVPSDTQDKTIGDHFAVASSAVQSTAPLNTDEATAFRELLNWEIDNLSADLRGACSETDNVYPRNLNLKDFYGYIPLPTLCYELEYPRQEKTNWAYVAEKTGATFGVLLVMVVVSQAFMYPIIIQTLQMKEQGMDLKQRLKEFPWILSDLIFPIMIEFLLSWYVIWECIVSHRIIRTQETRSPLSNNHTPQKLNVLAEVTKFSDRGFYADWWNASSFDQYARDWNVPVHQFLLRHVYHSSISAFHLSRTTATMVTFLLSAFVHELVMWCIFKKLRGYLLCMQMLQLPLVMFSKSKLMKGRDTLGNVMFWASIMCGSSCCCSLYLVL